MMQMVTDDRELRQVQGGWGAAWVAFAVMFEVVAYGAGWLCGM